MAWSYMSPLPEPAPRRRGGPQVAVLFLGIDEEIEGFFNSFAIGAGFIGGVVVGDHGEGGEAGVADVVMGLRAAAWGAVSFCRMSDQRPSGS